MEALRISNSPLLDPSHCTVVLISPDELDDSSVDSNHATSRRVTEAITRAAEVAGVPLIVLSAHHPEGKSPSLPAQLSRPPPLRFLFEPHRSPWSHKLFVKALGAKDRTILILAGVWFEHEILATALNALVDGYDVYVLLDASASRSPLAFAVARERLTQAGGTPVTTSQVICEWSFETVDASTRASLMAILADLLDEK
jgi:hypothetical protein